MYRTVFALLAGAASCAFGQIPTVIQIDIETSQPTTPITPTTASSQALSKRCRQSPRRRSPASSV
jgi:hypothetical protein